PADVPPGGEPRVGAAARSARLRVLMDRVHRVLERLAEARELARGPIAVEENNVPGVHRPDRLNRTTVEIDKRRARLVGGFVEQVIADYLRPVRVARGDLFTTRAGPVLALPVL